MVSSLNPRLETDGISSLKKIFLYSSRKDTVATNTENEGHEPNEMKGILIPQQLPISLIGYV